MEKEIEDKKMMEIFLSHNVVHHFFHHMFS